MYMAFSLLSALAVVLYSITDGVQDSITFKRVHEGKHPFKDVWHIAKHLSRFFLIMLGFTFAISVMYAPGLAWVFNILILFGLSLFLKDTIWDKLIYDYNEQLYEADENVNITSGIPWLDKLLGLDK